MTQLLHLMATDMILPFIVYFVAIFRFGPKRLRLQRKTILIVISVLMAAVLLDASNPHYHVTGNLFSILPFIVLFVAIFRFGPKRLRLQRKTILIVISVFMAAVLLYANRPHYHFPFWVGVLFSIVAIIATILITVRLTRWLMGYNKWVAALLTPFLLLCVAGLLMGFDGFALDEPRAIEGVLPSAMFLFLIGVALNLNGTFRGWYGEQQVARHLKRLTKKHPGQYRVLNGVLLQGEKHSSEIDHVVLSCHGIFVIETKAYKHVSIADDGRWYAGAGFAQKLGNPCTQNMRHIVALKSVLGTAPFFSLVVLTCARVSGALPKGTVMLGSVILAIRAHTEQLIEEVEVKRMFEHLSEANADSPDARKEHIRRCRAKAVAAQRIS